MGSRLFCIFQNYFSGKNKGSHVVYNIRQRRVSKGDEKNDNF